MRQFLIALCCAVPMLFLLGVAGVFWAVSNITIDSFETPFSRAYDLGKGHKVVVHGVSKGGGLHGDYINEYTIDLRLAGKSRESVTTGYRANEDEPRGRFRLLEGKRRLYLVNESEIYYRPRNGGIWRVWSSRGQDTLYYFGRIIMPDRYAQNEKFRRDVNSESDKIRHRLPAPPFYTFERLAASEDTVVLRNTGVQDYADPTGVCPPAGLWPGRLAFTNWKFDLKRTLALNPKLKLRPFPRNVQAELLRVTFLPGTNWRVKILRSNNGQAFHNYNLLTKVPDAVVAERRKFFLTNTTQRVALGSNPGGLVLCGFCGDPNRNVAHFKWNLAGNSQSHGIAHNGEWWPLMSGEKRVVLARFQWKP